jgi:hypothetical protein
MEEEIKTTEEKEEEVVPETLSINITEEVVTEDKMV